MEENRHTDYDGNFRWSSRLREQNGDGLDKNPDTPLKPINNYLIQTRNFISSYDNLVFLRIR